MSYSRLKNSLAFSMALASWSAVPGQTFNGFALYNSMNNSTAYLINAAGQIAHTWSCPTNANYSMALKPNGNIVRGAVYSGNLISSAAVGGMVQELAPNGSVVWSFTYSTTNYVTHHDMCLMPNGNVLLLAYVKHTLAELQALGYTGSSAKYPGRIIEIQPTGSTAQVVWEWNLEDRFIQHADATKPNYLVIAEHPERMNINVTVSGGGGPGGGIDWFHENGVDYNEELDQIAFSSRYLSEIFIIDHSTTTAEAAGHTAGNGGRGGDFLFRWGKPANYGITGTQVITAAVHDVHWLKSDRPNAGWLQYVNNSGGSGNSTTADAINPDRVGYNYPWTPGTVWGPTTYQWRHNALANSSGQCTSDRMPNGDVFMAVSGQYMYEAPVTGAAIWQYNASPPTGFRYLCDDPGILALLGDPCGITTVTEESVLQPTSLVPNPSTGLFQLAGVDPSKLSDIVVRDAIGREVLRTRAGLTIDLGDQPEGIYQVVLEYRTGERACHKVVVQR